jgi:hypothetical protein
MNQYHYKSLRENEGRSLEIPERFVNSATLFYDGSKKDKNYLGELEDEATIYDHYCYLFRFIYSY